MWSSYAAVGLTARGAVGSVEIHWPEVSEAVFKEASVLQQVVKLGFKAPEVKGSSPRVDPSRRDSLARDQLFHATS